MRCKALLIAVDVYEDAKIDALKGCVNDAAFFGRALADMGFEVTVLSQSPTLDAIGRVLKELEGQLGEGDLFVLFFAGHGKEQDDGNLLCLLANADHRDLAQGRLDHLPPGWLSWKFLWRRVSEWRGVRSLFIFDACRMPLTAQERQERAAQVVLDEEADGPKVRDFRLRHTTAVHEQLRQRNSARILSCQSRQEAQELGNHLGVAHGLFSAALIDEVRQQAQAAQGWVCDEAFLQRVSERMEGLRRTSPGAHKLRRQTPMLEGSQVQLLAAAPAHPGASARLERLQDDFLRQLEAGQLDSPPNDNAARTLIQLETLGLPVRVFNDYQQRLARQQAEHAQAERERLENELRAKVQRELQDQAKREQAERERREREAQEQAERLKQQQAREQAQREQAQRERREREVREQEAERVRQEQAREQARREQREREAQAKLQSHPCPLPGMAQDGWGVYADLKFKEVVQRFRWMEPGSFLMGSPETEPERWNDEGPQHRVKLTQGFWLADTACTQALWLAVVGGENPSRFQGEDDLPVESVSWDDVMQQFMPKLQGLLPAGVEATLPSEAQWEYVCRAGTQTPFSFGKQINPEQVNYDGNCPYNGGPKGEYRGKTVPVKALPANSWGLYQMHGNVFEWCFDSRRTYAEGETVDPLGAVGDGPRAVRGGSWYAFARYARSAYRYQNGRDDRWNNIGVRVALRFKPSLGADAPAFRAAGPGVLGSEAPRAEPGALRRSGAATPAPAEPKPDDREAAARPAWWRQLLGD